MLPFPGSTNSDQAKSHPVAFPRAFDMPLEEHLPFKFCMENMQQHVSAECTRPNEPIDQSCIEARQPVHAADLFVLGHMHLPVSVNAVAV